MFIEHNNTQQYTTFFEILHGEPSVFSTTYRQIPARMLCFWLRATSNQIAKLFKWRASAPIVGFAPIRSRVERGSSGAGLSLPMERVIRTAFDA